MVKSKLFSSLASWLKSTEMFTQPSKQIPGKWNLTEYYIEPENELEHITTQKMETNNLFWKIEFSDKGNFFHKSNLTIPIVAQIENGTWNYSKNYITLIHSGDINKNVEFQCAIEKGIMKMLKKDGFGKIEFFGFFRTQNSIE